MFDNQQESYRPFALKIFPGFRSEHGINDYDDPKFVANMKYAEDQGIPVMIHAEESGDMFSGEARAMPKFCALVEKFPEIKFVLARVSVAETIEAVWKLNNQGFKVLGLINPQHAICCQTDFYRDGKIFDPNFYMNPVLNSCENCSAIFRAMVDTSPHFALGSDSVAKTDRSKKLPNPSAGIYWPPEILYSVLLHYFKDSGYADWENLFIRFVRTNAKKFFGLEPIYNDANLVTLVHGQWIVPSVYPDIPVFSNNPKWSTKCVYPFWAGRELHWKLGIDSQEI